MTEFEIILKWKSGLSKNKLAEIYKREYNHQIRIIRSTVRHRYDGNYISSYEALKHIENIIYNFLKNNK